MQGKTIVVINKEKNFDINFERLSLIKLLSTKIFVPEQKISNIILL
jgi:hypothetical protein